MDNLHIFWAVMSGETITHLVQILGVCVCVYLLCLPIYLEFCYVQNEDEKQLSNTGFISINIAILSMIIVYFPHIHRSVYNIHVLFVFSPVLMKN